MKDSQQAGNEKPTTNNTGRKIMKDTDFDELPEYIKLNDYFEYLEMLGRDVGRNLMSIEGCEIGELNLFERCELYDETNSLARFIPEEPGQIEFSKVWLYLFLEDTLYFLHNKNVRKRKSSCRRAAKIAELEEEARNGVI